MWSRTSLLCSMCPTGAQCDARQPRNSNGAARRERCEQKEAVGFCRPARGERQVSLMTSMCRSGCSDRSRTLSKRRWQTQTSAVVLPTSKNFPLTRPANGHGVVRSPTVNAKPARSVRRMLDLASGAAHDKRELHRPAQPLRRAPRALLSVNIPCAVRATPSNTEKSGAA